jgi:hypothetical protein
MTDDKVSRLKWHAGLQTDGPPGFPSIAECTWLPNKKSGLLEVAVADVLDQLEQINIELNGPIPSRSVNKVDSIPRQLASAIDQIARLLSDAKRKSVVPSEQEKFGAMAGQISLAWSGVLAGDIDSILDYVRDEEWARQ